MKRNITILIALLLSFNLTAQNGIIKGKVVNDKNNEQIPFASIKVVGSPSKVAANDSGNFIITSINPGFVKLIISSIGYDELITEDYAVSNAKITFVEIRLKENAISLNEFVVKSSVFEKKIESPISMQRLEISDIEKSPGGNRDISKVIQTLPGVASTPAYRNDIVVRGGGSFENRFFLDNVEIPNINHFATQGSSGGPVGIINTDFIREVEFYAGAFPANKGNALSSVLDMKLIEGNKDKMNYKATLGASDLAFTVNGPLAPNTTLIFSVRRSYLQFLFTALGLPFLPTYNDFQFKVKTKFDAKNELTILGLGAIDQNELNLKANKTEMQRYILGYLPVNQQWNYTNGYVFKHFRKNNYDTWVFSRNMLRNTSYKYLNNEKIDSLKTYNYKSDEIENKLRYENNSTFKGYSLNIGAGIEYAKYNNSTFQKTFINTTPFTINYNSAFDMFKWNIFGQISRPFMHDRLTVSFGVRSDANNYSSSMSNLLDQFSPRVSASYMITKTLSLNATIGRYFELPPYTTLGFKNNVGELINKQNNLKYIEAIHYVAGLEYHPTENIKASIEGFYKDYRKYPFTVSDSIAIASKGADFGTFGDQEVVSTGKGRAFGTELLVRAKIDSKFDMILTYTLVRSEFQDKKETYIPSAWDNRNLVNITMIKKFKHNWQAGFRWRYSGGTPYTPYDVNQSSFIQAWNAQGRAYLDYAQFNQLRLKGYHQLDVRIDKEYFFNKWSLNVYADIQNVYNSKASMQNELILATNPDGTPLIDSSNPNKYVLKSIPNISGSVVPTIGLIFEF